MHTRYEPALEGALLIGREKHPQVDRVTLLLPPGVNCPGASLSMGRLLRMTSGCDCPAMTSGTCCTKAAVRQEAEKQVSGEGQGEVSKGRHDASQERSLSFHQAPGKGSVEYPQSISSAFNSWQTGIAGTLDRLASSPIGTQDTRASALWCTWCYQGTSKPREAAPHAKRRSPALQKAALLLNEHTRLRG